MSAMRPEWLWLAEFSWAKDEAARGELASTGSVQPMTQAKTAIHTESAVAIPAFMVCKVSRISKCIIRLQTTKSRN